MSPTPTPRLQETLDILDELAAPEPTSSPRAGVAELLDGLTTPTRKRIEQMLLNELRPSRVVRNLIRYHNEVTLHNEAP